MDYLNSYDPVKGDDEAQLSKILVYKHFIQKERTLYKTLNMFKVSDHFFVGLIWVPVKYEKALFDKKDEMLDQLQLNPKIVKREIDPELTTPTFFEDNEFTFAAQQIID